MGLILWGVGSTKVFSHAFHSIKLHILITAVLKFYAAVEVESAGVASAAFSAFEKIGFISIRSICDFVDNQKEDGWQGFAANSSALFTRYFLCSGQVPVLGRGMWPNIGRTACGSFLQRNWRPGLMVFFAGLIGGYWFGFTPENLSEESIQDLFELVKLGIGGYVVGRSAEKIAQTIAPKMGKK